MIVIIDQSTKSGYNDALGTALAAALAHQIRYHVAPSYGLLSTSVAWLGKATSLVPANAWPIYLLDDPDVAGALGYHDLDPKGNPYGRVFVTPTSDAGVSLSSVISHEVVEAFVDPWANAWADSNHGVSIAFEACDPVEDSSYRISGVEVSNFVTKAWFDPENTTRKVDYLGHLGYRPFSIEKNGYLIVMKDGAVSQTFGQEYPEWRKILKSAPQPSRAAWRIVRQLENG